MTTPDDLDEELPTNWGRWGFDDELGTLNFITDEARARGAELVTSGHAVSLAMPITPVVLAGGGPAPQGLSPMPAPVLQMMTFTGSPALALTDVLIINTHHVAMTHIDAVVHIPAESKIYPGIPINEAVRAGTVKHGSTTPLAGGVVTRGILLDLAPGGRLAPGHPVTGTDFDLAEAREGLRVKSGDALVIRGGWTVHKDFKDGLPGMTVDAIRWMAEREVSLYAGDIGDLPPGNGLPILHKVALARLGMPLIDGAEVSLLATTCEELGRYSFLFTLGALPIHGVTGVPVNPLAVF